MGVQWTLGAWTLAMLHGTGRGASLAGPGPWTLDRVRG